MLISETHFTYKSYFKIPSYSMYHTNHPDNTAQAGLAIIIKNEICHYAEPKFEANELQAASIKVTLQPYLWSVATVYCSPRQYIKKEASF